MMKTNQINWLILVIISCSGCANRQIVTASYPFWGEPTSLQVSGAHDQRSLQQLNPKQPDLIRGCMLMVHGMNEHIGRYGDIARHFANRFIVYGVDLTAHGMSNKVLANAHDSVAGNAGNYDVSDAYLEQAQFHDLQSMRDDLQLALKHIEATCTHPNDNKPLPIYILSHSLGSLVASSYLLQSKDAPLTKRVKGIILSGPAFSVTEIPGWRGWFQNPIVDFTFYSHEHFLDPHDEPIPIMLFNQLIALLTVPLQDGLVELSSLPGMRQLLSPVAPPWSRDYLTDSEEEKERLNKDGYMVRRSVMRYVLAIEKEIIAFRRTMKEFDMPYILIYSENDPITPAWGNIDFIAATRKNNKQNQVILLAGKQHHEQLFSAEPLKGQLLEIIDDWLSRLDLRR